MPNLTKLNYFGPEIQNSDCGNSDCGNSDGGNSDGGNSDCANSDFCMNQAKGETACFTGKSRRFQNDRTLPKNKLSFQLEEDPDSTQLYVDYRLLWMQYGDRWYLIETDYQMMCGRLIKATPPGHTTDITMLLTRYTTPLYLCC